MKPKTVQELVETIGAIADKAPSLPVMYYHYPALYTVDFDMAEFLQLASQTKSNGGIPSLHGVKYIDGDMKTLVRATGVTNDNNLRDNGNVSSTYTLYNNDPLLAGMVMGSKGAISYTNIFPLVAQMRAAFARGDMAAAQAVQRQVLQWDALISTFGGKSAARNLPLLFGMST